jgi:hypothetical protein
MEKTYKLDWDGDMYRDRTGERLDGVTFSVCDSISRWFDIEDEEGALPNTIYVTLTDCMEPDPHRYRFGTTSTLTVIRDLDSGERIEVTMSYMRAVKRLGLDNFSMEVEVDEPEVDDEVTVRKGPLLDEWLVPVKVQAATRSTGQWVYIEAGEELP